MSVNKEETTSKTNKKAIKKKLTDEILQQMAIEEITREISIKSVRAKEIGPTGWLDCPLKRTNKRFLGNTIKAAVTHNERRTDKEKTNAGKKLLELEYEKDPSRRPKFGDRKFVFKKPKKS